MRRIIAILICCCPLLGACTPAQVAAVRARMGISTHPAEDDVHFNCHYDGNGICGPVTINLRTSQVIAQNGTFPYARVDYAGDSGYGYTVCVAGYRPLRPSAGITPLACSRSIIR